MDWRFFSLTLLSLGEFGIRMSDIFIFLAFVLLSAATPVCVFRELIQLSSLLGYASFCTNALYLIDKTLGSNSAVFALNIYVLIYHSFNATKKHIYVFFFIRHIINVYLMLNEI